MLVVVGVIAFGLMAAGVYLFSRPTSSPSPQVDPVRLEVPAQEDESQGEGQLVPVETVVGPHVTGRVTTVARPRQRAAEVGAQIRVERDGEQVAEAQGRVGVPFVLPYERPEGDGASYRAVVTLAGHASREFRLLDPREDLGEVQLFQQLAYRGRVVPVGTVKATGVGITQWEVQSRRTQRPGGWGS